MHRPAARYVLPEFTERTSQGTRTLDPYSKLLAERVVFLGTQVDDVAANDLVAQFMYLEHNEPDRPIQLYINSPGGSFAAMTAVYDAMAFLTCEVETFCLGQAGAAAAVLLAAGAPGRRHALPGAHGSCCSSRNSPNPCRGSRPIWRSRPGNWPGCARR